MMKPYQNKDDKDLFYLVSKNDEKALKELILRYERLLMRIAVFYLKEVTDAEEVVGDLFFNIWQKRKNLKIDGNIKNYLSISIKNNCFSLLQKHKKRKIISYGHDYEGVYPDNIKSDDHIIMEELHTSLTSFLETLPEQRSLIFSLAKFEGLSFEEIADLLNISPKTVANQVSLALKGVSIHIKNSQ
ncbi:RNA polymerase sigma factor [Anditalea andensis]|uniref:RNA polymerase sigma-70 factor n=1 Tax=Anditalea andensis TaxID=1048983 RepID=A0A074LNX6_9BACT|nr:sigma-70 family RNA polymerase sigma factor [Anditalea andensis]KEO75597.1 hypothetical protein EL17_00450 [Anditalea andensis]